jgi:general secretion pathway protein K
MRVTPTRPNRGIALIIVMMVILVLSVLAGGFAYSMKVETRLARNTAWESDMEWLGRSGVELGKYCLAMQAASPAPENQYSALTQLWAGGPPNPTNELLADINLKDVKLGPGTFTVTMQDMERKFNLSALSEGNPQSQVILERALLLVGADSSDIPTIIDSYFDWVDPDNKPHLAGAESADYLRMPAPYYAKNGPVDDIRELLLIKGMTEQIFWGTARVGPAPDRDANGRPLKMKRPISPYLESLPQLPTSGVGLYDLFTPFHGAGQAVNINTASAEVLEVAGLDPQMASALVAAREENPFLSINDALGAIGADASVAPGLQRMFVVRSRVYEITVDAEIGTYRRRFVALVDVRSPREVTTLSFTWK